MFLNFCGPSVLSSFRIPVLGAPDQLSSRLRQLCRPCLAVFVRNMGTIAISPLPAVVLLGVWGLGLGTSGMWRIGAPSVWSCGLHSGGAIEGLLLVAYRGCTSKEGFKKVCEGLMVL